MRGVDAVFEHVLGMQLKPLLVEARSWVVVGRAAAVVEAREDVGDVEERLTTLGVMPDVDGLIAFHHWVDAHPAPSIGPILIRDADVATFVIPLPTVEGALDHLT